MATTDIDLSTLGIRNIIVDQITRDAKVHLQTILGATNL